MDIIQAINDPHFFKPSFKDLRTWQNWMTFLRTLFGLPLADVELELFKHCTGREKPPERAVREAYVVAGRRSGKSFISSIIAVYLACFRDWSDCLTRGERGWIFIIAVDKAQASIIKNYISGILNSTPSFSAAVDHETQWEIHLKNHVVISVKTCNFRSVRGYTVLSCVLEEVAFWRDENSANPAKEIITALRPSLATIGESMLIGISTPYSRSGALWQQYREHFGKEDEVLVWRSSSQVMNPTIDQGLIDSAIRQDPQAARAEWLAEWRQDISSFIPPEIVEACVIPGRYELPPLKDVQYSAFIDPSGGRQDSFTLAIAHREKSGKVVLDVLQERIPPFQPQAVVEEYSNVLKRYGIHSAGSDRYAGEWVTEAFSKCGITVENSELSSSELYLELLPVLSNGGIELLDNKRLAAQLAGLERRTRAGGKDLVTHYAGGHDDLAVGLGGVSFMCLKESDYVRSTLIMPEREPLTLEQKLEDESMRWLLNLPQRKKDDDITDEELEAEMKLDDEEGNSDGETRHGW